MALSSANTMTANSSRLDITRTPTPDLAMTYSQQSLNRPAHTGSNDSSPSTRTPSLNSPSWINASLNLRHLDYIVLTTCFVTGLIDTAMFANYSTFVSMQTGNTIFLGLGASNQNTNSFVWIRCIFSLFSYCLGTFAFARLHDKVLAPKTRRLTLLLSYLFQASLIAISAGIIQSGVVGRYTPGIRKAPHEQWDSLAPVCLLSLGAGGQIVAARSMGVPEVPTVVVTTMLCELWSDPALFVKKNIGRNRRAAGFALMLLGAVTSGWMDKVSETTQAALWFAAALKLACVAVLAIWKSEAVEETNEKTTMEV